ncbi:malonyl-ACP O-methyltransferase BioC [Marinimicrobium sp. ABcell2]|uniref:malonyl-ACP O-methyltransferase BioC n=1 Tax=Marinimicrobium sp. ABcell2 TaxID=3069751 RepID=UPI0027AEDC96|nr:malonyl-ACP O-methyltransferase BioC [Marinimicrobium sp. ABcell2]MDQ2076323.1 malonyl-ACP O-methyltransferase BioC [Marinimicrobium sp. ABcell2]
MTNPLTSVAANLPQSRQLAAHHYPALSEKPGDPLVLLHGWGCDSGSWEPLLPVLRQFGDVIAIDLPGFGESAPVPGFDLGTVLQRLEDSLPPRATLIGWSLGGMLAVALAERCPDKVQRVVTLASNLAFVARADWPAAMAPAINRRFNAGFKADPAATWRRFTGLMAQGDSEERTLLKELRKAFSGPDVSAHTWSEALQLLAQLDNRERFARLPQPGLHLYAEADALVPLAAAEAVPQLNNRQTVAVIPGAGHALHWSRPVEVVEHIGRFLRRDAGQLDKRRVANSFSRAASSYDRVARLQRAVSERLLELLPKSAVEATRILDLGCGTGYITERLAQNRPGAQVLGLDLAEGMLHFARGQRSMPAQWLCADAEALPLAPDSLDLVYSSLSIQWCEQVSGLFNELQRVIMPGGTLAFSTLGPGTLRELKQAWQAVDGYVHVNRFLPMEDLEAALTAAGFVDIQWHREERVLHYAQLGDLTRELKALGAHNVNRGGPEGLTGRHKIAALKEAYELFRVDGQLPASYDVYYCQAVAGQLTEDTPHA